MCNASDGYYVVLLLLYPLARTGPSMGYDNWMRVILNRFTPTVPEIVVLYQNLRKSSSPLSFGQVNKLRANFIWPNNSVEQSCTNLGPKCNPSKLE